MNASGANETLAVHHQLTSQALYRIVPITIYGNGVTCNIYAFLDDGSGPTLIEKDVLRQLRIKGETKDLCLRWTDGTVRKEPDSELVNLQVSKIREGKRETLNLHICECDDDLSLQRLVKDFVSNENVIESREKLKNMELEQQKTRLLWKSNNITMPDNYLMALRKLQCFERKLQSNVTLQSWVCDHIDDMKSKGYIRQLKSNEAEEYYPPAQYDGVSLNACLEKGPDLLTSLVDVLVNFGIGKIGISGDIQEMFHRVLVKEEDQHSQRFLWRNCDDSRPPDVYLLQVMSFGATCSPSLTQLVKNSNAREYEAELPRAVKFWRSGVSWDDTIPNELVDEWNKWLLLLGGVKNVKIPRCYFATVNKDADSIELHVFVDASEVAYAAVVYLRAKSRNNIDVSLICSKAKVAPLRPISIPRLELLVAELGARLGNNIKRSIDLKVTSITYWSDSKAVLSWIKSDPRDYKQFVMFRIAEILELSEAEQWRYIPTKLNVADLATKQTSNPDFTWKNPWYKVPKFLYEAETCWPNNVGVQKYNEGSEIRKQRLLVAHVAEEEPIIDVYRFSEWERLVRCMAYVKRFMFLLSTNEMKKMKSVNQCLSVEKLKWSENFLYQTAQLQNYKKEMTALSRDANITPSKSSPLRKLSPFTECFKNER
ncbi:uncharacterized protein LOC119675446 [Teleopsis dalmanni]|uniref:uncharacterized protein LOC119675446 n=1 Tax=Teleopsis dalmanni TaxID=139649 RepID=UPI0018CCB0F2|nr:uncharacterized protein LOC119675446 [Teleopsis dalmanni]